MRWEIDPAEVALGTLDEPDRRRAEALMAGDPSFRAEVDRLRRAADRLRALPADAWSPGPPPPLDLDAALAARPARSPRGARPARRRVLVLRPAVALAAAAACLAVGVVAGLRAQGGGDADTLPARAAIALRPFDAGRPGQYASVRLPTRRGAPAHVVASGLPASRPGQFYELWLIAPSSGAIVPVGSFRAGPDGTADVELPLGSDPRGFEVLDLSVERKDGNPAHSGVSLLRGPLPA